MPVLKIWQEEQGLLFMKNDIAYALDRFENAAKKLKDGVESAKNELEKDGVIQRFEFCFELLWKTGKIVLQDKGIQVLNPRDTLKEMFRQGWLPDEAGAIDMLEDRNNMSHIYDKRTAGEIYGKIKSAHKDYIMKVYENMHELAGE